jgi:hypothetical protein
VPTLINAALFQLTWFSAVLGGAADQPWWGLAALSCLVVFSLRGASFRADVAIAVFLVVVGWLLQLLWVELGVLVYPDVGVPAWIPILWVGVGLTVNHSLAWFQRYPFCVAALAAVAAPLCYLGGEQLGAVVVPDPLRLIWVSLSWLVLFYAVFWSMPRYLENGGRLATVRR